MKMLLQLLMMGCIIGIAACGVAKSHDLLPLGELPALDADWELQEADSSKHPGTPVRWIVFRNKVSGDLLSLATYPPESQPKRDLIYQSDTAHECFPSGLPAWNRPKDEPGPHHAQLRCHPSQNPGFAKHHIRQCRGAEVLLHQ